jgi:hypothetical protein
MQWYPGPEGDQRIWYESDEIEQIAAEQLTRAGLLPTLSNPVTDLERFIEEHLRADLDQYADLPEGVLGLTRFPARGHPVVLINKVLTEARDQEEVTPGSVGRWRATLAHEASHIYLHRYLFDPEMAQLSGGNRTDVPTDGGLMRCLHRDISPTMGDWATVRRRSDWREVQANRGKAALLMPRRVFRRVALREMGQLGLGNSASENSPNTEALVSAIATTLEVSKQAATIRLKSEGLLKPAGA